MLLPVLGPLRFHRINGTPKEGVHAGPFRPQPDQTQAHSLADNSPLAHQHSWSQGLKLSIFATDSQRFGHPVRWYEMAIVWLRCSICRNTMGSWSPTKTYLQVAPESSPPSQEESSLLSHHFFSAAWVCWESNLVRWRHALTQKIPDDSTEFHSLANKGWILVGEKSWQDPSAAPPLVGGNSPTFSCRKKIGSPENPQKGNEGPPENGWVGRLFHFPFEMVPFRGTC